MEATVTLGVDITELKKGIKDAEKQIDIAQSSFKALSSGMEDWAHTTDGVTAKISTLEQVLDQQKKKLELLKAEYEYTAEKEGALSNGSVKLLKQYNDMQAAVNKTAKSLEYYRGRMDEIEQANKEAQTTYAKLADSIADQEDDLSKLKKAYANVVLEQGKGSKEAKSLAKQIKSLSSETAKNKTEMNNAEQAADKFDKTLVDLDEQTQETSDGFSVMRGAVATFVGNLASSAASAIKGGITNLAGLAESTREYRGEMAKLDSAAQSNGYSIEYAQQKYKDLYGVLGDETAANTTVSNFMAMGTSTQNLDSLLNSSIGIWAKYGDSIPLDGLAESVNETTRVGQVTGNLADALNWAGVNEDKFNEQLAACSSEQERQQLVVDTLNGLYGDLSGSYQEANKSVIDANKANADYQDTLAQLGAKVEPVTTAVRNGFNKILEKVLELVNQGDMSKFTDTIDKGFSVLTDKVLPKVEDGFQWILDNKEKIITGIAGIAAGFAAFKIGTAIMSAISTFQKMNTLVQSGTGIMKAFNIVTGMNPFVLIVSGAIALITVLATLWNTSESFRNFWTGVWESIKEVAGGAVDALVGFFTETIPEAWGSFTSWLSDFISGIISFFSQLPGKIGKFLRKLISDVISWKDEMISNAVETGTDFLDSIVSFFKQLPGKVLDFITNVLANVIKWRADMIKKAQETGKNFLDSIVSFFKQLPGRIWDFVTTAFNNVVKWQQNMVNKAIETGKNFLGSIVSFFSQLPGRIWGFVTTAFNNVVKWAQNMVNKAVETGRNFLDSIVSFFKQLPGRIWDFVTTAFNNVVKWQQNMVNKAVETGRNFLDSIVSFFSQLPGRIWDFVTSAFNNVVTWAQNMWNKAQETGRNFLDSIVSFFSQLPGRIWDFITSAYSNVSSWASDMWNKASEMGSNFLSNVVSFFTQLPGQIADFLGSALDRVFSWAGDLASAGADAASGLFDSIYNGIIGLPDTMASIGSNLVSGIWNGISDMTGWIIDKIGGFTDSVVNSICDFFGINSPSRVMRKKVGPYIPQGLGLGITENAKYAVNAMKKLGKAMLPEEEEIKGRLGGVTGRLRGSIRSAYERVAPTVNRITNFYQTNNSPKALSRLEIYRQTRNQLALAKGD